MWQAMLALLACAAMGCAHAEVNTVFFAGVAFTGDAAAVARDFPHIKPLLDGDGARDVNGAIRQQLRTHPTPVTVSFDSLGSIRDARQSTALALAIDRETASVEQVGALYKVRLEVAAQALFFDFKEKQVLGGIPLVLDFVDVRATRPDDAEISASFRRLLLDPSSTTSLAAEFVAAIGRSSIPSAASRHLRVTSVTLADKAIEYIHTTSPSTNDDALRASIAQEFGKYLGANQHVSILPYRSNAAIGSSMAARFVEGESYDLKIPEADYEVSLDIAGFKKIQQGSSNVNTIFIYGSFVDITVREPLSGKVYFQQRVKQGATKDVPVTQANVDDWAATWESLLLLFNNFTQAVSVPGSPWTRSALPEGAAPRAQLSSLADLIKASR
jgi:hypothetical protein